METISIQVEPQVAQAYRAFAPQRQKQVQMLMSIILQQIPIKPATSLIS